MRRGFAFGLVLLVSIGAVAQQLPDLWSHVYHPGRLQIQQARAVATGTIVDASHGKNKDGCRHEADGDFHCWLKLDAGQEQFLNQENVNKQEGNLVFEPMCQHKPTQEDAKAVCKDWKQQITLVPLGSHARITGSAVLDTQHGHKEFHPVEKLEVIP
jgi:hypothetical protein